MSDNTTELQKRIEDLESQLRGSAVTNAISRLPFLNESCRELAHQTIAAQVKRSKDGTYTAAGLTLADYIQFGGLDWLPGMLSEVPAGTPVNNAGLVRREAANSFDIDGISAKMKPEDKAKARAAIASVIREMGIPTSSGTGIKPL
jgi:hypothetical protein